MSEETSSLSLRIEYRVPNLMNIFLLHNIIPLIVYSLLFRMARQYVKANFWLKFEGFKWVFTFYFIGIKLKLKFESPQNSGDTVCKTSQSAGCTLSLLEVVIWFWCSVILMRSFMTSSTGTIPLPLSSHWSRSPISFKTPLTCWCMNGIAIHWSCCFIILQRVPHWWLPGWLESSHWQPDGLCWWRSTGENFDSHLIVENTLRPRDMGLVRYFAIIL